MRKLMAMLLPAVLLVGCEGGSAPSKVLSEVLDRVEEVKAVIAFKPGQSATPEDIIAYCKEHLAAYKYPRIVEIRDSLPKGPTGKILKRELRS